MPFSPAHNVLTKGASAGLRAALLALAAVAALTTACERPATPTTQPVLPPTRDMVKTPSTKPAYTFAPGLEREYPEITAFVRHLIETCLAGDYGEYRRLVATRAEPETRKRFERLLQALRGLDIESVESVTLSQYPGPVYRVVGQATFEIPPQRQQDRQRGPRRLAILVVQEDGQWRTMAAPPGLQPRRDHEPVDDEETPTTGPSYPWDELGDG